MNLITTSKFPVSELNDDLKSDTDRTNVTQVPYMPLTDNRKRGYGNLNTVAKKFFVASLCPSLVAPFKSRYLCSCGCISALPLTSVKFIVTTGYMWESKVICMEFMPSISLEPARLFFIS